MTTTSTVALTTQPQQPNLSTANTFILLWQLLVGAGCVLGAIGLLQLEDLFNLGSVVKIFLAVVVLCIGAASLISVPLLYRTNNSGRLMAMALDFIGMILALFYLGHLIGIYVGIDVLADGLSTNIGWLYAIAGGYVVVWLGGRFAEDSPLNHILTRGGLGVMMLSLIAVLLASGLLDSIRTLITAFFRVDVLAVAVIAVVFGIVAWLLLRQGARFNETISERETWQGWLFVMPNFVNFMLFFAAPLLLSFYLSFTNYDAVSSADFIGFENYRTMLSLDAVSLSSPDQRPEFRQDHFEIFRVTIGSTIIAVGARDPLFWQSLANTFRYCIMLLLLSIFPALGLAILLNSKIPGMKFYRAIFFIPSIAAVVGVALIWKWLYDPIVGYINYTLTQIVTILNNITGGQIVDPKINWLTDDNVMLISVVIMAAWQVIGFNTVIFLAGLQGVPKELMEAATVDGAGRWTRFRKITLPLIAPTTFFVTVTTLIAGLQVFSEVFVLIGTSTSNAKMTTVYYLYQQGFQLFKMGYASATAWVLFIVIFVVTLIQFRLSSKSQAYSD